jgi:hypothetical protein
VPGFNSQIFLAPDDGVGVMAFTNGSRNAASWLRGEMEQLLRGLIGIPPEGIRGDVPQRPDIWGELCGRYRPRAQRTDMQAWSTIGAAAEVRVRRGQLILRTLSPIRRHTEAFSCRTGRPVRRSQITIAAPLEILAGQSDGDESRSGPQSVPTLIVPSSSITALPCTAQSSGWSSGPTSIGSSRSCWARAPSPSSSTR